MTALAQYLQKESPTVSAIYASYKKRGDAEQPRGYLGASIIGHPCERYLWFTFRFCCRPEFDGRMYRLFSTGDHEEARFVADLRAIGCTVHEVDPNTGKQFEVTALGGHFSGHMDGCAIGIPEAQKTWHVLEFKTHNAKSFAKLQKDGVKKAKPQHYAQMQVYMHLTGMTRALYLAVNKNTDELYAERVHYNKEEAEALMARAERVITSTTPPERAFTRPDYFECSWCDANEVCWGSNEKALPIPAVNCRQCCHATPMMDGCARLQCEKHGRSLSPGDQCRACDDHLVLPGLITFAEPFNYAKDESGYDYIDFAIHSERKEWRHGRCVGAFSTKELTTLPVSAITDPTLAAAKRVLGAVATGYSADDILARYPESDSRIIWRGPLSLLGEAWRTTYSEDIASLTPIAKCEVFDYKAAEFERGRVAIVWLDKKQIGSNNAEIREGIE